jgi:hypothetical protein
VSPATGELQQQDYRLSWVLGTACVLALIILCAIRPLLALVALVGLIGVVLVKPVRLTLVLLVVAVPLFPSLHNVASLTTVRCDEFLLLALATLWLMQTLAGRRIVLVGKDVMLLLVCAIAWGLIGFTYAAVTTSSGGRVTELFVSYRRVQWLLLFFLVIQEVDTVEQAKRLLLMTVLVSAIVSVIGLLQFADVGPTRDVLRSFYTIPGVSRTHYYARVTATFDTHPNALGAYYVIILSIVTAMLAALPRRFLNPVWLGVLVLGYVTVAASASRAGLFALVIGLVMISVMRRIWLLFAMTPPVALGIYFFGGRMTERLVEFYNAVLYGRIPMHRSLGQHIRHWSLALDMMEGMPVVGRGFGGDSAFAINRYVDNYYLYLTYHEGYLSLLLFAVLLAVVLLTLYRIATGSKDEFIRAAALGLLAGTVGLSAHAMGADTFTWERVTMVLWLCLALVIRADSLVDEQGEAVPQPDDAQVAQQLGAQDARAEQASR